MRSCRNTQFPSLAIHQGGDTECREGWEYIDICCGLEILHSTLYTLHSTLNTQRSTLYTLHSTLRPSLWIWNILKSICHLKLPFFSICMPLKNFFDALICIFVIKILLLLFVTFNISEHTIQYTNTLHSIHIYHIYLYPLIVPHSLGCPYYKHPVHTNSSNVGQWSLQLSKYLIHQLSIISQTNS